MAKNLYYLISLHLFLCSVHDSMANDCLSRTYTQEIGVRELTGKNDGVRVEEYLASVNLGKGYAWCAAFVKWCLMRCGISSPVTAWSPSAHNSKNVVYAKGQLLQEPEKGDVFTVWYPSLKRIGHTGFYDGVAGDGLVYTVEGNTNDGGSRNGDGVYRRKRRLKALHTISRWH